jgi:thiol-disulfide isomerase/thioredoxin
MTTPKTKTGSTSPSSTSRTTTNTNNPKVATARTSAQSGRSGQASTSSSQATSQKAHQSHRRLARVKPKERKTQQNTITTMLGRISSTTWTLIITGVILVGFVAFAWALNNNGNTTNGAVSDASVGSKAPAIDPLLDTEGNTIDPMQYIGKEVVILDLFAPWCPSCQAVVPTLNRVQAEYKDQGVKVIGITTSPDGFTRGVPITLDDLKQFKAQFGVQYTELLDPSTKVASDYKVTGYPSLYIINKRGEIAYKSVGAKTFEELKVEIDKVLNS